MDEIKEAITERIKSPYLGYSLLAFTAINWKAFFILYSLEGSPTYRIMIFNRYTDTYSLFIYPIFIGISIAIASPWAKLAFTFLSKKATEWTEGHILDSRYINNIKEESYKQDLLSHRKELLEHSAAIENAMIERSKRDKEISLMKDSDVKNQLESEIKDARNILNGHSVEHAPPKDTVKKNEYWSTRIMELIGESEPFIESLEFPKQNNKPDPIGALNPNVAVFSKYLYKTLIKEKSLTLPIDSQFANKYKELIIILHKKNLISLEPDGPGQFNIKKITLDNPVYLLYISGLEEKNSNINLLINLLDSCQIGDYLRDYNVTDNTLLPIELIRTVFRIYHTAGRGFLTDKDGSLNYQSAV